VEVQLHALLTSVLNGGEWSASCPSHFNPREIAPGTHWIGGWVLLEYNFTTALMHGLCVLLSSY